MPLSRRAAPLLLAMVLGLPGAGCAAKAPDTDFAAAAAHSRAVAEKLQSYAIEATMVVSSGVEGMDPAMNLEVALSSAGQWPQRLANRQSGTGFTVDLGSGPDGAWLHISQLGTCYVGPAATLTRDLESAGQFELTAESVYNFYSGLTDYLLKSEPAASGEPVTETLTVDGREIPCLVYSFAAEEGQPVEGAVLRGAGRAWYDPASGLVLKSQRELRVLQGGNPVSQNLVTTVNRFSVDKPVSAERFVYAVPAGVRTVDNLDRVTNPDAMTGQTAPDIALSRFDGTTTRLSDHRGKVVFLNFWATWCPPCRMEMPHIETLFRELKDAGDVVFLGASSEDKETITKFLKKNDYSFPMVTVDQQDVAVTYRTQSIPSIFVIDGEGVIRAHLVGAQTEQQMRRALAKAGIE